MNQINIKNLQEIITHSAQFDNEQKQQEWIESCIVSNAWGKPERIISENDFQIINENIDEAINIEIKIDELTQKEVKYYTFKCEYTIEIKNITEEVEFQNKLNRGILAQQVGNEVIAMVYAINEMKLLNNELSTEEFQSILNDQNIQFIERLLKNGSLETAKNLIVTYSTSLFTENEKNQIISKIDNFLNN